MGNVIDVLVQLTADHKVGDKKTERGKVRWLLEFDAQLTDTVVSRQERERERERERVVGGGAGGRQAD